MRFRSSDNLNAGKWSTVLNLHFDKCKTSASRIVLPMALSTRVPGTSTVLCVKVGMYCSYNQVCVAIHSTGSCSPVQLYSASRRTTYV